MDNKADVRTVQDVLSALYVLEIIDPEVTNYIYCQVYDNHVQAKIQQWGF